MDLYKDLFSCRYDTHLLVKVQIIYASILCQINALAFKKKCIFVKYLESCLVKKKKGQAFLTSVK